MTKKDATVLIPEAQLIDELAPHWKKRFVKATQIMQDRFSENLNWNDIADECAISPSHFHYMFKLVFGESPVHYLRRMRLKQAVYSLSLEKKAVTDIALETGFSSSQALAKALKRELGMSASQIRRSNRLEDADLWDQIMLKLGQPTESETSLEKALCKNLKFELVHFPERYFFTSKQQGHNLENIFNVWFQITPKDIANGISIYHWSAAVSPASQPFFVGYECAAHQSNKTLPASHYLSTTVILDSGTAYSAAWDALYSHLLERNLEPDYDAEVFEQMSNLRDYNAREMEVSLFLPVKIKDQT
ncbi:AraC family transcriptional regulator [Pseudoteredinibacter isoporae]|uniref:AraC-like DNA-binding protein n=1 Tax=Pseudoteredinibacter isoporae TaxID=570281 RepID=A0A7X0JRF6_9GAMM|nr:AraC family transcriptional regulator [Pseudoteredinibacter isoporae]MBB6520933.1 AraC-like DNA-binding protein [Pseudoteredinibacter isoporae]NHO86498.1 AraC family transcriptional regulator [Pseudoteredinibacter isoporae]NIB25050.1 AraC family transcriptional regulator [Pseudoteredinibacter isoporae]